MSKSKLLTGVLSAAVYLGAAFMPAMTVYAENSIPTDTVGSVTEGSASSGSSSTGSGTSMAESSDMPSSSDIIRESVGLPVKTTEEIGDHLIQQGYTIVDYMRLSGIVICIGAFVVAVGLMVFGALSKKATIVPGLIAAIIAVVSFGLIWYAPYIVAWGKTLLVFD